MNQFVELLRQHQEAFEAQYSNQLSQDMRDAIYAISSCQTELQRKTKWCCDHCHHLEQHPLSCGHRHCPQCQHQTTSQWLSRQQQKLLPTHYFMATFTLPYEFRVLAATHPKALYQLLFIVVASIMKDFAYNKHQGEIGFTMVLHTHNRKRDLHPHIHVVIPAGYYIKARQQWHKGTKNYLHNEFALANVWRARILEAINQHDTLQLPKKHPKDWVVDCRSVGYGEHALQYLSRYLYRGVLPDKDITNITDDSVTFQYRDSQTKCLNTRTLPTLKFLWLILQHVLPKGLQRVRDYGFLRGNAKKLRQCIQLLLITTYRWIPPVSQPSKKAIRICPCCQHEMKCVGVTRLTEPKGYSINIMTATRQQELMLIRN